MITKDEAFAMTLYDISQGETLETMRYVLKDYEEREQYEVCAGIHLAIEVSSFLTLTAVVEEFNPIEFKQGWQYNKTLDTHNKIKFNHAYPEWFEILDKFKNTL
jgi:hypothetical protein